MYTTTNGIMITIQKKCNEIISNLLPRFCPLLVYFNEQHVILGKLFIKIWLPLYPVVS